MYNILLVDDEARERKITKILLEKKFENLFHINEAESGEEAITILSEGGADILFIDIQMPGINGLDVVKKVREKNHSIYIVILTAFNYFDYAKTAIEIGVNDFLLKPIIRDELSKTINKFIKHHHMIKEKYNTSSLLSKNLTSLLAFGSRDEYEIRRYFNLLNINKQYGYSIIFTNNDLDNNYQIIKNYYKLIVNILDQELKKIDRSYVGNLIGSKIVIFIFTDETDKIQESKKIEYLIKKVNRNLTKKLSYEQGNIYKIGTMLEKSFLEALKHFNNRGFVLNTKDYEKLISKKLNEGFLESAKTIIRDIFINLSEETEYDKVKFKLIEILTEVTKKNLSKDIYHEYLDELSMILKIYSTENLIKFIMGYLDKLELEISKSFNIKSHHIVDQIVFYIENKYMENITIDQLAEKFYISTFYLSKIFKENRNKTFTDYLTEIRINKSIELMETNKSIKQIALEVGYTDANYFSRVFKKRTGCTPSDYRKEYII